MSRVYVAAACLIVAGCELNRTGLPDDGNGLPSYEKERAACVDHINAFRATEGLPPLQRWVGIETCADGEAKQDFETGKPHSAFAACEESAQNECPGWNSVQSTVDGCLQMMWDERLDPGGEQGHYEAMSSTRYTRVACGFYDGPTGKVWAVQDFR